MAKLIERYGGEVEMSSVEAGHAPNASCPGEVVKWILGMVERSSQ